MSTLTVQMPDSVCANARRLASQEGVSVDQFVSSAVAEKLAALDAERYLHERAERGRQIDINAIVANVPGVEPALEDRLPDHTQ